MKRIGVLGAGTWGTALARMLFLSGHEVTVWSAIGSEIDELMKTHKHKNLEGMIIPEGMGFTKDVKTVCRGKDILLFAVPSVFVRSTSRLACPYVKKNQVIVDVAKGVEPESLLFMSQVISSEIPQARVVALSGPTHAEEVARDLPTTIVSASEHVEAALLVQEVFTNPVMRVYTNSDIRGVELCGALKNVVALAAGISSGLGFGDNIKAAIITRGMGEIRKLGMKMGCLSETFSGLAGIGDLIVTATSKHSRNNQCGYMIGQGLKPADAVSRVGMVVEGINALPAAMELSERYGVEMPLVCAVDNIINHGANPRSEADRLMTLTGVAEV